MAISEDGFLGGFLPTLQQDASVVVPPGDDCAAIDLGTDQLLLAAIDQVAAGSHYYGADAETPTPPELAGRKLLARNLSDIAAMGGTPTYILASIGLPFDSSEDRLKRFAAGMVALAEEFGVSLVGGDLGKAPSETASLTILGTVARDRICLRTNAKPGDAIFVTGHFGDSLASGRHLRFQPRIAEGKWLAEHDFTRCMIDTSDGLLKDLERICKASAVAATLDPTTIPCNTDLHAALLDGEDYELIVAVPAEKTSLLEEAWPFNTALTRIGSFQAGKAIVFDDTGTSIREQFGEGFEHF